MSSLTVCHANIRSLSRAKLLAIKTSLSKKYDIITLSETHLHCGVSDDVFELNGFYDIIRKDRTDKGCGGVAIYVKRGVVFKRIYELEVPDLEVICISVQTRQGKILLCSCYRPPDKTDFWDKFDSLIDDIKETNAYKYLFFLGDLNSNFNTTNGNKLSQLCLDQNLKYLINEPTRITEDSATILDQILTNAPNFVSDIAVSPPISTTDHCTISATIHLKINKEKPYYRDVWLFDKADFSKFRETISETDFDSLFNLDDINDICESWTNKLLDAAKQSIPHRRILVRPNDSPWYSTELRRKKRHVYRAFRKFKNTGTNNDWESYRTMRNGYQQDLNKAETDYNDSLSSSLAESKNTKYWWRTVKSLLGKGSFRSLPPMNVNNDFIVDSSEKASAFNNFFLSHSNINTENASLPSEGTSEVRLSSVKATEQEVNDQLMTLDPSKATGPDGIGPRLLKEAGRTIVPTLTRLINLCLSTSTVPDMWKQANVIPLFKKGDDSLMNNYRPISLLPSVSKILERIVLKSVYNFMLDNKVISPHQSGFQPGDSTTNQLSFLYHTFCQALDAKKDVRIVFCDISKAFDRVWHKGLLYKLEKIGIGGSLLSFFRNYLSDRTQRVVINGQNSVPGIIKAGVPQGSVLGPLLFLIYINDITEGIESNIKMFADDTSLFIDVDDPIQATAILNRDLQKIEKWSDKWLVKFSAEKTKLMTCTFRSLNHPDITFNNTILSETKEYKHLGLTFSSNLSWSAHIKAVLEAASPMADVLKKLKYKVDKDTLEKIYFSFIRPKLEYGSHIWDNCNLRDKDSLDTFQMNIAKTVTGARKGTSHKLIMNELEWQNLSERREGTKLKNFIHLVDKSAPQYLQDLLPQNIGATRSISRNPLNYNSLKTRIETFKTSFIPSTISIWNNTPLEERNIASVKSIMKTKSKPLKLLLTYQGERVENVKLAQLRMNCSRLNYHLNLLHVHDSPACLCGHSCEDAKHFLLHCPLYGHFRNLMINAIREVTQIEVSLNLLLYGSESIDFDTNCTIVKAVHTYIRSTKRL